MGVKGSSLLLQPELPHAQLKLNKYHINPIKCSRDIAFYERGWHHILNQPLNDALKKWARLFKTNDIVS